MGAKLSSTNRSRHNLPSVNCSDGNAEKICFQIRTLPEYPSARANAVDVLCFNGINLKHCRMTPSPTPPPHVDRNRRIVLGWSGVGIVTVIAGLLGWRTAQRRGGPAVPAAQPPRNASSIASSSTDDLTSQRTPEPPLVDPTREKFVPHLGSEFQVDVNGVHRDCKLIEVSPTSTLRAPKATYTAYTLLFEAHAAYKFESQIYKVKHATMGTMELFLSPVGDLKKKAYLEAVFTHRA
jgi:hypothetical protein